MRWLEVEEAQRVNVYERMIYGAFKVGRIRSSHIMYSLSEMRWLRSQTQALNIGTRTCENVREGRGDGGNGDGEKVETLPSQITRVL